MKVVIETYLGYKRACYRHSKTPTFLAAGADSLCNIMDNAASAPSGARPAAMRQVRFVLGIPDTMLQEASTGPI